MKSLFYLRSIKYRLNTNRLFDNYLGIEDENGNRQFVDIETGEILDSYTVTVPVGTSFRTPHSQYKYQEYHKRETEKLVRRKANSGLGHFFWLTIDECFYELLPTSVTRLLYLCTYVSYDRDGRYILMQSERTPLYKNHLPEFLSVSRATANRFWRDVSPKYLMEQENHTISLIANDSIRKGILSYKNDADTRQGYFKAFCQPLRSLYKLNQDKHKRIGYVFKLIPYINREYNILCCNTDEIDIDELQPLSKDDISKVIGTDTHHIDDIISCLCDTNFTVIEAGSKPHSENLMIRYKSKHSPEQLFYQVNPYILYRGNDYRHALHFGEINELDTL